MKVEKRPAIRDQFCNRIRPKKSAAGRPSIGSSQSTGILAAFLGKKVRQLSIGWIRLGHASISQLRWPNRLWHERCCKLRGVCLEGQQSRNEVGFITFLRPTWARHDRWSRPSFCTRTIERLNPSARTRTTVVRWRVSVIPVTCPQCYSVAGAASIAIPEFLDAEMI